MRRDARDRYREVELPRLAMTPADGARNRSGSTNGCSAIREVDHEMAVSMVLRGILAATSARAQTTSDRWAWNAYGGDPGGSRYAPVAQIDTTNVGQLRLAWVARTGDFLTDRGRFEATPILADTTLYVSTPLGSVLALDAATGAERWKFDGPVRFGYDDYGDFANRGVAVWGDRRSNTACALRIFVATVNARLIALDGRTGKPCSDFGANGTIDLTVGLRHQPAFHWEYGVTSPPMVVRNLVILGSAVPDNHRTDAPDGVVRAFDVRTGALRWSFDPIPRQPTIPDTGAGSGQPHTTRARGTRGASFLPIPRATWYSSRPAVRARISMAASAGATIVMPIALSRMRASTGAMVWAFQVVHHDLWDYDVPAQPVLFTWTHNGQRVPAVAVATKMGHVFILDRLTGKPLVPVTERPVPASDVPGEQASATQPFPPPAYRFAPETLSAHETPLA